MSSHLLQALEAAVGRYKENHVTTPEIEKALGFGFAAGMDYKRSLSCGKEFSAEELQHAVEFAFKSGFKNGIDRDWTVDEAWEQFLKVMELLTVADANVKSFSEFMKPI